MRARPFHHGDPGTPEADWLACRGWDRARVVDADAALAGVTRLVVLAAHPDDETLGAGGLMALAAARGVPVDVVVATDGDASHPGSPVPASTLADLRRAESRRAAQLVAPGARVRFLGRGDGLLTERSDLVDDLTALLTDRAEQGETQAERARSTVVDGTPRSTVVDGTPDLLVVAPWERDGHPDHDALGAAAVAACPAVGARLWRYPIWAWHWARPDEFPWESAVVVPLDAPAAHARDAAVDAHATQVEPLVAGLDASPLLGPHVLDRHRRLVETFLTEAAPGAGPEASATQTDRADGGAEPADGAAAPFDAMFEDGDDPWHDVTWYERRKRALLLAALGRERYGRALEIGCSTGTLGAELARRSDAYLGLDVSTRAVEIARSRHGRPGVVFARGHAPADVPTDPAAPFDLVVLSEVGYFLTGDALLATLRAARAVLAEGGEIVLCHWRHPTSDIPLDGPLVHAQARRALDLPRRVAYRDDDVLLDVYGAGPSVAERDGLA